MIHCILVQTVLSSLSIHFNIGFRIARSTLIFHNSSSFVTMAAKYPSEKSIQIKIGDLLINSEKEDPESTNEILNMCVKCSNYVMANQFNIFSVLSGHKCVVRCPSSTAENLNICMHKTINAISNYDGDFANLFARYRSQQFLTPPVSLLDMSSVVSISNEIEMKETVYFDLPGRFMTSTPKGKLPSKKDDR